MKGEMFRGLYYRVDIAYTNSPSLSNAEQGAENLDTFLHSKAGKKVVTGHSMGAQVIYKWMRDYGPSSDIDPDDVGFISSGNMERKYGGIAHVDDGNISGIPIIAGYGGNGLPDPCPWTVVDVARQYDPFADYPTEADVEPAQDNIDKAFSLIKDNPHSDYTTVSLTDPGNVKFVEGTVTYILAPYFPLPMVRKTYWYLVASSQAYKDESLRPQVEAHYDRPFTSVPTAPPVYSRTKWSPWGWDTVNEKWVRVHRQDVERQPPTTLFF